MASIRRFSTSLYSNLAIAAFAGAALVLSMSDRMPMLWRAALLQVLRVGRSVEYRLSIDLFDRNDLGLEPDQLGHVILWGSGMFIIGLVTRGRFQAAFVAVVLFVTSVALEVAQTMLTSTRAMSTTDALANAAGIMAGLTALVVLEVALGASKSKSDNGGVIHRNR